MSVTLENLGVTSLAGTPTASTLATKSLVEGTNVSISSTSTDVTISADVPLNEDYCILFNSVSQATSASLANITFDTALEDPSSMYDAMNPDRINILVDGIYRISTDIVSNPNGAPSSYVYLNWYDSVGMSANVIGFSFNSGSTFGAGRITTIGSFVAGDYLYISMQTGSGAGQCITSAPDYFSPIFSAIRLGSA